MVQLSGGNTPCWSKTSKGIHVGAKASYPFISALFYQGGGWEKRGRLRIRERNMGRERNWGGEETEDGGRENGEFFNESFNFARWKGFRDLLHNNANILNTTKFVVQMIKMVNVMLRVCFLPQLKNCFKNISTSFSFLSSFPLLLPSLPGQVSLSPGHGPCQTRH